MRAVAVPSLIVAAAVTIVTAGCGSGSQSPLAPTQGAVIEGTLFTTNASLGSSSTQGIRVSVVNMPLVTTSDAAGRFTLDGLPPGSAVLQFQGQGVDARLEVPGLRDGQVLTIGVQVSGSQAVLTSSGPNPAPTPRPSPTPSPSGGEVEFRGTIASVNAPNLVVAGRLVRTSGSTSIQDSGKSVPFSSLRAGQLVEVEGTAQADGSVLARQIHIEDDGNDDGNDDNGMQLKFTGAIQSIAPPSLKVAGRTVVTNGSTQVLDHQNNPIPLGALQVGQTVEVEGTQQANGSVLAKKVKLED